MKWMFGLIIVLFAPSIVLSQVITCHRCFGNTYCNNASHPDFQANIRVAGCGTLLSTNNVETENEAKLRAIEKKINPGISTMIDGVYHQCITATVFEDTFDRTSLQDMGGTTILLFVVTLLLLLAQGEAYNFYYITESKRGGEYYSTAPYQNFTSIISVGFAVALWMLKDKIIG
ncbi:uncharacterized protein LOC115876428 isoform X2 [Sitophilus oryzae]|uniref:Uncharacterized protein LOC115876428 isoform X2 n=1 Tax=Sitophilus oryzae TaxID=7048 RepID=A0A6J2XA06_SITOR|nr:uncharacterized protein LOC115876428 isoform X2 [Sitophilus oryzae]